MDDARKFIESHLGPKYVPQSPIEYKSKKRTQDAHEAVRPTSLEFTPEMVKPYLDNDQFHLYDLIWRRFLACQTTSSIADQTAVDLESCSGDVKYEYRATGSVLKFDGFRAFWPVADEKSGDDDTQLPELTEQSPSVLL